MTEHERFVLEQWLFIGALVAIFALLARVSYSAYERGRRDASEHQRRLAALDERDTPTRVNDARDAGNDPVVPTMRLDGVNAVEELRGLQPGGESESDVVQD